MIPAIPERRQRRNGTCKADNRGAVAVPALENRPVSTQCPIPAPGKPGGSLGIAAQKPRAGKAESWRPIAGRLCRYGAKL